MSRKLLLIARPRAMESVWVAREVAECLRRRRDLIILDINGAFAQAPEDSKVRRLIQDGRDLLRIPERLDGPDGEPNDAVIEELVRSFKATRQETIRLRIFAAAAAALLVVTVLSVWQTVLATIARDIADQERKKKESALLEAQRNVAVGLFRPVGDSRSYSLPLELNSLWDLAGSTVDQEAVRLLFFEQALNEPDKAQRLDPSPTERPPRVRSTISEKCAEKTDRGCSSTPSGRAHGRPRARRAGRWFF